MYIKLYCEAQAKARIGKVWSLKGSTSPGP